MASSTRRSLASRATSVARRVTGRGSSSAASDSEQPAAKKAPAKKAPAKKTSAATKASAKKAPAKKASAAKTPATKAAAKKAPAKKAPAKKAPAKKTSAAKAPAKKAPVKKATAALLKTLVVLPGEKAWTKPELDGVLDQLRADVARLSQELDVADDQLHDLMIDSGDGAGADSADLGSSTHERDQEMTIANNARDMLEQSQHSLDRIADGSYGVCESCGEPIGKLRLMAFPRATLCMACKTREERR